MIARRDDVDIAYEAHGAGPLTIVFVHGLAANFHTWDAQVDGLAATYRTIAIDLPGHGGSFTGNQPSKDDFFRDVRAIVEADRAGRVVVVGWSLGGRVACEYALSFPYETAGIVLVDHNPPVIARTRRDVDEITDLLDAGDWPTAATNLVESWIGGGEPAIDELRQGLIDMVVKTDPDVVRTIRGRPWRDVLDYSTVPVPTLLIQGGSSPLGGIPSSDYLLSEISECEALVIAGHGHAVHVSAADDVTAKIAEFAGRLI